MRNEPMEEWGINPGYYVLIGLSEIRRVHPRASHSRYPWRLPDVHAQDLLRVSDLRQSLSYAGE
jgi:hypothetical protein